MHKIHNRKYNKKEIEKNIMLFESSLNEVFVKLMLDPSNQILYQRAETTLELARHVKESLNKYHDSYIKNTKNKIDDYHLRFEEIKKNLKCNLTPSLI